MSKQKSAVEQFAEQLASKNLLGIYTHDEMVMLDDLLNQFKEIEKEKLEDAWVEGVKNWNPSKSFEQYYEQTYGGNK